MTPILVSYLPVAALYLLLLYLRFRRLPPSAPNPDRLKAAPIDERQLPAATILKLEFNYAKATASEAMNDRHTMVNYYLIIVGIVTSGVLVILETTELPNVLGTLMLWLLCVVGVLYLLTIIRLRQAWHDSARTMNRIKEYYISHVLELPPLSFKDAFRWREHGLPNIDKKWNVFYYSACLIGLLNAVGFYAGGVLLFDVNFSPESVDIFTWLDLSVAVLFFLLHPLLYTTMLKKPKPPKKGQPDHAQNDRPGMPSIHALEEDTPYSFGDKFSVVKGTFRLRFPDGTDSDPLTRISFERGDSAGILLCDRDHDRVILVRQFRYPVYRTLLREGGDLQKAWMVEIAAGIIDDMDQTPEGVVQRELLEEAGYAVKGPLTHVTTMYASPGASSERIHVFLGEVDPQSPQESGGGLTEEGEYTEVVTMPVREALDAVHAGDIVDAKTVVALQYLASVSQPGAGEA